MSEPGSPWAGLAAATVCDSIAAARILDPGIRHLAGPAQMAGPAFTVATGSGGYSAVAAALDAAPPGAVLVIAGGAETSRAIWGEVSSARAAGRRLGGAIVDGAVRDLDAMGDGPVPVFARGTTPRGPDRQMHGEIDVEVECGGVRVGSGDVVVADRDGIVVVPVGAVAEGLELAWAAEGRERERLREVVDALPLGARDAAGGDSRAGIGGPSPDGNAILRLVS